MKTIAKLRESDTGGSAEVKRIAMLLSVVALMVVMLAMGVAPAFAAKNEYNCRVSSTYKHSTITHFVTTGTYYDRNGDGIYCAYQNYSTLDWTYADNHPKVIE
jgi:hypothetical protein